MNKSTLSTFRTFSLIIISILVLSLFSCFTTGPKEDISKYNRCMVTFKFHGHFKQTLHSNNSTSNVDWEEEWGGEYSVAIGSFDGNTFTGSWDETDDGERTWGSVTVILHEGVDEHGDLIYDKVTSVDWTENFTYSHDGAAGSTTSSFSGFDIELVDLNIDDELYFFELGDEVCNHISSPVSETNGPNVDFSLQNYTCTIGVAMVEVKFYNK